MEKQIKVSAFFVQKRKREKDEKEKQGSSFGKSTVQLTVLF